MGNCNSAKEFNNYNSYLDSNERSTIDEAGPFVHPKFGSYENLNTINEKITLFELIEANIKKHLSYPALGYREPLVVKSELDKEYSSEYKWFTYGQIWKWAQSLSKCMHKLNLCPVKVFTEEEGEYKFMGIYSKNCAEWVMIDLACQMNSITSSTFYATLGEEAFDHILKQSMIEAICISPENINNLIKYHEKYNFESLKSIIVFNMTQMTKDEDIERLQKSGFKVYMISDLANAPDEQLVDIKCTPSSSDTLLTLCYTSGTTKLPKGVKLTQKAFGAQMTNLDDIDMIIGPKDMHFSYLPLAHVMERFCILKCLVNAVPIGFLSGDLRKYLVEDMAKIRPTFLVAVPRVLSTFRQQILDQFSKLEGFKKSTVDSALDSKRYNFNHNGVLTHWFYDGVVFKKVRDKFGGRIRTFITGSAPLPKEIGIDIKIMFSATIVEAYGLTETTGAVVATNSHDTRNNHCGGAFRTNNIKLLAVPEMNYGPNTTDEHNFHSPTGEICVKGINVTKGYFRDQLNTEATIDKDGWLHTGDVGRIIYNDGGLKIIDRVKEIFKLSQGEYIAPSKLEGCYSKSSYISQICVYGDSEKTFCIGIIFPNKVNIKPFLMKENLIKEGIERDVEDFYDTEIVHKEIIRDLEVLANNANFNSLEKLKNIICSKEEFTPSSGLLTPTMKLVRHMFKNKFLPELEAIYNKKD